eukprot:scaffold229248_cov35-Tisochrysis_lutea.AAC.3
MEAWRQTVATRGAHIGFSTPPRACSRSSGAGGRWRSGRHGRTETGSAGQGWLAVLLESVRECTRLRTAPHSRKAWERDCGWEAVGQKAEGRECEAMLRRCSHEREVTWVGSCLVRPRGKTGEAGKGG